MLSRLNWRLVFPHAVLVILAGCSDDDSPSNAVPADKSLAVADYIQRGLPAIDRPWSGSDMRTAHKVFAAIAHTELPRHKSERSGAVFARMIAAENLDVIRNQPLPLENRMPEAMAYGGSSNGILKIYIAAFAQRATGGAEVVELMGLGLRNIAVMLQIVNEFLPTLDKNDPTYPVRMDGLRKVRSGCATVIAGNLQTLTERDVYRTSELKTLITYLRDTLPKILSSVSDASRTETLRRLQSFESDPKLQDLNPELAELLSVVEKTIEALDSSHDKF